MMKLIKILAIANLLAVVGFVGWLVATDRVNRERLERVREIFHPTIAAEKTAIAEQIVSAERFQQRAALAVRSLQDEQRRLLEDLSSRERGVTEREEALAKRQTDWETSISEEKERQTKDQFRKAVRLLESAPAKQGKEWILELVKSNREDQAVAYLDAMNPAKSAGLLKAFKGEGEAKVATDLLERLRQLGLESEINAGAPNGVNSAESAADSARANPAAPAGRPAGPTTNGPAKLPGSAGA